MIRFYTARGDSAIPDARGSRLAKGDRLGPYEIESSLGSGGMGEVFRATDTRLGRTVAIKILSADLAAREDLRSRFEVEARAIASLSHPQICALFDVGQQGDVVYMVMEHLDGQTLAARLANGALPLSQALSYGVQIAQALEQAHRRGIIHRDIKPGNIMLTAAGPKLLDFGLARLRGNSPAAAEATRAATQAGVILGTPQYMAPEQIAGEDVDARSDLFSLGAVLYEMVSGQRAFAGASPSAAMGAILRGDPPAPLLSVPAALERAIQTCLVRDPDERWQSAGDLRRELTWIAKGESAGALASGQGLGRREMLAWGTAAVLGVAGVGAFLRSRPAPPPPARGRTMFDITVPTGAAINPFSSPPTISPDGRLIAFSVATDGPPRIWVRALDGLTASPIAGTENANSFFWSPDSRSIGFCVLRNMLKRIDVDGGALQTLCETQGRVSGGTWNRDGVILFNFGPSEGLYQIPANGGTPRPVTSVEATQHRAHLYPWFLPDGRRFLFTGIAEDGERQGIYIGSLDSSEMTRVLAASSNAAYAPPGFLLFARDKKVVAQAFDPVRLQLAGSPVVVAERVWMMSAVNVMQANFSVSENGTLVFANAGTLSGQLTWIDRAGRRLGVVGSPAPFIHIDLARDESRVLLERYDEELNKGDVWMLDLSRGETLTRLTSGREWVYQPFWSGDGQRIVYAKSGLQSTGNVTVVDPTGAGGEVVVARDAMPTDWSDDGHIVYSSSPGAADAGMWTLPVADPTRAAVFLRGDAASGFAAHGGRLSPDGRWMAYVSNENGDLGIFLRPFPKGDARFPVSNGGGTLPRWRADGKELFYRARDGMLMAVSIVTSPRLQIGAPAPLFALHGVEYYVARSDYAPARDGQRFLVNVGLGRLDTNSLTVLEGWQAGLER